jgi:hypothetical protein
MATARLMDEMTGPMSRPFSVGGETFPGTFSLRAFMSPNGGAVFT